MTIVLSQVSEVHFGNPKLWSCSQFYEIYRTGVVHKNILLKSNFNSLTHIQSCPDIMLTHL